ncbi:hypothetical protein TNCV_1027431 [Trichonephila clavipes]|nr:hypothetical protein TNCV_1027431 [Trichonephila clavipes]
MIAWLNQCNVGRYVSSVNEQCPLAACKIKRQCVCTNNSDRLCTGVEKLKRSQSTTSVAYCVETKHHLIGKVQITAHEIHHGKGLVVRLSLAVALSTIQLITCNFGFVDSRSGIFDVKDTPRTGRPVVENVDKITEIIEVDRHVSSCSIVQELKIDHKTVLKLFVQSWIQKEAPCLGATPIKTKKKKKKKRWIELPSAKPLPNGMKSTNFLNGWWLGMRNGLHTTVLCENDRCQSAVK